MLHSGQRAIEHAQEMVALERDMAVKAVSRALAQPGAADCSDCGEEISEERRAAMPSARRCITCESRREVAARRGW